VTPSHVTPFGTSEAEGGGLTAALDGRYAIVREVGRGATAVVYLARDVKHDRLVALKVLHPALGADRWASRFLREIKTAARLHHPHILPLFDSGAAGGRLYYTMPLVEGESLRQQLRREGLLPVARAAAIAAAVADALAYAHARGVVHRDVKPENIMLSPDGHVLLADFGIASLIDGSSDGATETGVALGTPAYMSPEQAASDSAVDGRSDIYALGCVLYEMLAGDPPHAGPNARAVLVRRLREPAPPVRSLRGDVPPSLEQALDQALALDPDDRFTTAAEFGAAVTAAITAVSSPGSAIPALHAAPPPGGGPARDVAGPVGDRATNGTRRGLRRTLARSPVSRPAWAGLALALALGGAVALPLARRGATSGDGPTGGRKMLVVLPFKNLGPPEDQYFADGLTEEITSRLAGLSGMGVISRTSADQYRNTTKPLRQIGAELGVGYVLEGSVRWERTDSGAGRVRVTPQLIRVTDDTHLWTDQYDREITEIFRVQGEIAGQVSGALDVALREPEREALAAELTQNSEAYDYYLRGKEYNNRGWAKRDLESAAELYEKAIALDPNFAAAHAKLAQTYVQMYWHHHDRTQARLARARHEAEEALRLSPGLPDGHMAMGFYHYYGFRDYDRALEQFALARRTQPRNPDLLRAIGLVERRRGRWAEAVAAMKEGLALDPRSQLRAMDIGDTYFSMRMYPEAERYIDRAIALAPDWGMPYTYKAQLYLIWTGDLRRSSDVARWAIERVGVGRFTPNITSHDVTSASVLVADTGLRPVVDGLSLQTFESDDFRYYLLKAEAYGLRGRAALARAYADSARAVLEPRVRESPDAYLYHRALGLAYAMLARKADAIREGRRAVELLPMSSDANSGPYMRSNLARIYMLVGEPDSAVAELEPLLSIPSWISIPALRADPVWEPLRASPRFRQLVYGRP